MRQGKGQMPLTIEGQKKRSQATSMTVNMTTSQRTWMRMDATGLRGKRA